jgi:hypothetical protein
MEGHMKKIIVGATAVSMLGIVVLTFTMCAAPAQTPESPSYLPRP